ncbi:unknown [Tannerella sp. CAG:118]|nr:unknown [Tannerella sp. CAG:118]
MGKEKVNHHWLTFPFVHQKNILNQSMNEYHLLLLKNFVFS